MRPSASPPPPKLSLRQRYTLVASGLFIALGILIVVRSILAAVLPLIVFGAVLIALGVVRIRDFLLWRGQTRGK